MGHSAAVWDSRMALEKTKDWNGIDQIVLRNPQGASAKAIFKPPKAMRGGIPICFPQFGNCGSLEQHGFARNKIWVVEDDPPPLPANDSHGKSFVDLLLKPSEEDLKFWPHSFEFRLRVSLGMDGNLTLTSRIRNVNGKPFSFSFAYHSYLSVSDISSPNCVAVLDHERKRTYVLRKEGLPDVAMADLGDDEYKQMLCVDGAAIEKPITLKPGEEWTGRLEIAVVPSSFCSEDL
ncbi:Aldose 1-/Glucose-6-phosphate 1-epimerase [Cynara cardunculus var. scolymus]|uniref:Aldose 1-/Glucose-6-phosphate 1-epimerase n=1 Tax=Cynara cardunculus var. scolymus TaxID=59895 RepID=A0A124SAZ6_CYNCS|nr:Aldose 1-/Glucose-6-phosphate 1-epimerase [Cynara cardunculus var. scolymus]